jgi:hypothetical protein
VINCLEAYQVINPALIDSCVSLPADSTLLFAGAERYVHVYLPPAYDGATQWPIWVHLHGVFWATMGDIGARVSVLGTTAAAGAAAAVKPVAAVFGERATVGDTGAWVSVLETAAAAATTAAAEEDEERCTGRTRSYAATNPWKEGL